MNILVIGGAGYIGSHVVRELLDAGHSVRVFDDLSSGHRKNIFKDSFFIKGSILDYHKLTAAMMTSSKGPFDALIHLAAFKAAGESMTAPEKYSLNNITGTVNILNAALETGIKRVVFSSSAAVYGEPEYLPIDEAHPARPENYYGFTKLEIEKIMAWYDKLKGLRFASLRYFNAAGYDTKGRITALERNPANLLPIIMEAAIGLREGVKIFGSDYATADGTCIRDYVHVNDLARAHLSALEYIFKNDKSITLNLGSESGVSVLEMVNAAREITGIDIKSSFAEKRAGDSAKLVASSVRAGELLGWKAEHSSVESIIKTSWAVYKLSAGQVEI